MFGKLPAYADNKGDDFWAAPVPAHWVVAPGLAVCSENKRKNGDLAEAQVLSLSFGRVVVKPVEKQRGLVPDSYEGYQVLDPGDIVVRPTDLQNDQRSIRVGLVRDRGIITSAYIGLRTKTPWTTAYAHAYLSTVDSTKRIYGMGSGLRQQLGWTDIKRMPCLVPPAEEQATIVKYLTHANTRIDKAIAAKFRLIALLLEQRGSIARAIVRQAASEASLSVPSGLDWLGDVPSGWVKHRAKAILRDVDERSTTGLEEVLSVSHITGVTPRSEKQITMFEAASYVGHKLCRPDDLVVNTMWAWMAALGVSRHHGVVSPAYNVYRPMHEGVVDTAFLAYLLRSQPYNDMFRMYSTGVRPSRLRFYPDQMLATPLFLPPMDEQRRIVTRIAEGAVQADGAISRVEQEIDLLKEFRAHLVADVVTGQVDVRGIAASLPDIDQSASWSDSDSDDALELADLDDVIEASEV